MKITIYDFETTGLNPETCGVHQLAGAFAEIRGREIVVHEFFNLKMKPFPGDRIYQSALDVAGVTADDIKNYPDPRDAYKTFMQMQKKYVNQYDTSDKSFLVGYNNRKFDDEFMRKLVEKCEDKFFGSLFWNNTIDVMSEATRLLMQVRPYMTSFKLSSVARTLGMDVEEDKLHDASYDIVLTKFIFEKTLGCAILPLTGFNLGQMKNEVLEHKKLQKQEFLSRKPVNNEYVVMT